jgi:hypothetical protein
MQTIFQPNWLIFYLGSIQTSFDSGYRLPLHTTVLLHPPVAPPCRNQEPPCVPLSPSETSVDSSYLFLEREALKNPLSPRPIKGVENLTIRCRIHSPSYFWFLLKKNLLSSELKSPPPPLLTVRSHLSLRHPKRWSVRPWRAPLPPQISTTNSHVSQLPHAQTPVSS